MQQRYVAKDTAHAPHILVFQIAAVAPSQHHHGQAVFAAQQIIAQIEFRRQTTVLTVADPATVAPQMKCGIDAVKNNARLTFI